MNEKTIQVIFLSLGILILTLCRYFFSRTKTKKEKSIKRSDSEEAKLFVQKIDELGYLKYAEKSDLKELKDNLIENFDSNAEMSSVWDEETGIPKDYRYYWCDGEDLFEQGGFTEMLKKLNPTFEKINFKCDVNNHFEDWDDQNQWLNHTIIINGSEYIIFKNFTGNGWGEAPMRLAQIVNSELEKQNINERIYLASGGNDGRLIFLNKELYQYIFSVLKNEEWKPLQVDKWCEVMKVKKFK